jgi:FkbM family methyltransferase
MTQAIQTQPTCIRSNTRDMEYIDDVYFHRAYEVPWFHIEPHTIKTALDLGAHIGSFALWAAQRWPGCIIHSYEPNPESFELLTKNVGLLNYEEGRIKIFNLAVWKNDCTLQLYRCRTETGATSIMSEIMSALPDDVLPPIDINARSINVAIDNLGSWIDFFKMDCEGAEYEIMYSLPTEALSRIKFMAIEYHGYGDPYKLVAYLRDAGFAVQILPYYDNETMGYIYAANLDLVQVKVNDIIRYEKRYLLLSRVHELIFNKHTYDTAESLLKASLENNSEDPESNYLFAFCLHIQNKDLELAMKHYDLALAQSCDYFWIRYNRGSLYAKLGNIEAARIDLERALEMRPNDPAIRLMLYRLPMKGVEEKITKIREMIDKCQYQDAAVQLSDLVTVLPKDPELNYLFALCLHIQNKDLELAMNHYDLALQYGFDEFWVKYNRGSLFAKLGNNEQAKEDLMRAVELEPGHDGARKTLESLAL